MPDKKYDLQPLPIGVGDFEGLISSGFKYIDKTATIYELVKQPKSYYFLSRPRRFGKTLLCTTIKALYEGKRELFKGLAIDKLWGWSEGRVHPVLFLSMSSCEARDHKLLTTLILELLADVAKDLGIALSNRATPAGTLSEVIRAVYEQTGKKVVILIDEYDKPLHPFIGSTFKVKEADDEERLRVNIVRDQLADFYGVLKDNEAKIEFLLLTGVSRITKTNLFSKLNNLKDMSFNPAYATLLGYTHGEVKEYFDGYLACLAQSYDLTKEQIFDKLIAEYNGYKFHAQGEQVFNPFSLMQVLYTKQFENYWYNSGASNMLVRILEDYPTSPKHLLESHVSGSLYDSIDLTRPDIISLMFQTGYLTIKSREDDVYTLCSPNHEVSNSLQRTLAYDLSQLSNNTFTDYTQNIKRALKEDDMDTVLENIKALIYSIPYQVMKKMEREAQFQLIFYLIIKMLGFKIPMEQSMLGDRIDALLETPKRRFIIEFKYNKDPEQGLKQILEKGYLAPYATMKDKELYIMGISAFSKGKNPNEDVDPNCELVKWVIIRHEQS